VAVRDRGEVVGLYLTPEAGAPMQARPEVVLVAGDGIEGDRYAAGGGRWSKERGAGRQLTLIEQEAIDAAKRDYDVDLGQGATRRNVVTRDVALNHLVGRRFRVGQVELVGVRLAEPCAYLAGLTDGRVTRALLHRGGLRADILTDGTIRVGDHVTEIAPP
jgi:MOSC domain-containing protein YiiM